ncbi:putative nuclease HARBI1 [Magallana gigas]|uniref:putative nuclease HARBI1 n=1 Tax=Magallana gigas TaxID=29159 RepID=UPI003342962B
MADRRRRRRRLQRYWNRPSKRVIRDRLNPVEAYTDDELFERYRFRQVSVVDDEARKTKQEFIKITGFPNTLGCIDGTFIRILAPTENEPDFVNRKGFHSLNVQMVCDARFKFTSVCASWPGSVHDSRIWREFSLCRQFQRGEHNGILLGDSGYPCKRFLMTPYLNPQTNAHQRFNASLCRTRVLIEQSFGILKRRFSCLQGILRTTPEQAVGYVVACVILHNLGIQTGDVMDRVDQPMDAFDETAH